MSQMDFPGKPVYRRVVVKAGTSVLTGGSGFFGLRRDVIAGLVCQISRLREQGVETLLVTSGAIAAGREALEQRDAGPGAPKYRREHFGQDIRSRQVLAAVGQSRLMHDYQELFSAQGHLAAQTLLTIKDLSDRQSYLNVGNTLTGLLELGVIPILNENDVVAVDEIGEVFGDNDRLSALVSNLVNADLLVILTDTDGLYTADPNVDPTARLIPQVNRVDAEIEALAGKEIHSWARGGMSTKLEAARIVTSAGIAMVMCHGLAEDAVLKAASGQPIGTLFRPAAEKLEARKRWMLGAISPRGQLVVDPGAAIALGRQNRSLLPAGIKSVHRGFPAGRCDFRPEFRGTPHRLRHRQLPFVRHRSNPGCPFRQNPANPGVSLRTGSSPPQQPGVVVEQYEPQAREPGTNARTPGR